LWLFAKVVDGFDIVLWVFGWLLIWDMEAIYGEV
jgi:hypothetical protein